MAAFDRVNHSGLIYKLKSVGVGGPVLSVLEQFLSNRRHRVCVGGGVSGWSDVVSGVPQGRILGPILFVLYTSDLSHIVDSQVYCYADDTTLVAPVQRPSLRTAVGDVLNDDLAKVVDWCERWDMKLNPRKSKSLLVSRSRSELPPHPLIYADGDQIQEESHMKVLGVVLDSKLTYEEHLRQVASRARQKTGILRKGARLSAILGRCLRAYVLPLVEYCSPVWSSAAEIHLSLLDRVFNVASGIGGDASIDLAHRRSVGSLSLFWKILHDSSHPMRSMIPGPHPRSRVTRGVARLHELALQPLRTRTRQFDRAFLNRCVALWNDLPGEVFGGTLNVFKSNINKFLLSG